jgi:multidrug efflux system membrane fusion protein
MNIRISNALDSIPTKVQDVPGALRRADSRTRLILGIVGAVIALVLVWWVYHLLFPAKLAKAAPAAPVKVASVQRSTVTVTERTVGTILANATVQVTAQVGGQMMSAAFKEGDIVRAGQLIFRLDPRPFQAALEQAQAALAKDQAALVSAHNDQVRYAALFAQHAASQQQRDQADATAKGLAATVQSDRALVDVAKLNLNYSMIRSPIDGKTGPILVQPGNLVTANATSALVTITQLQPVKVSFFLPQTDLPQIQARMAQHQMVVTLQVHGAGGETLTAPVDFVSNAVSAQTGTIELRATFANLDNALVPGQLADTSVTVNQIDNATVVPHDAVNLGPAGSYVWIVGKDSKAKLQNVTVLNDDGNQAAVKAIKGKLAPGDRVITDGQLRVVPGAKVAVKSNLPGKASQPQAPAGAQ